MNILKDSFKKGIPFFDVLEVDLPASAKAIATLTNQDSRDFVITNIINASVVTATGAKYKDFTFKFEDKGSNYNFSYKQIHASTLGSGRVPTQLRVPYILKGTSDLGLTVENNLAVNAKVRIVVRGYKVARNNEVREKCQIGTLFYDMFSVSLIAGQALTSIINNQDEKAILFDEIVAYAIDSTNTVVNTFKFAIKDSGSKELFSNNFITGDALGDGEFPTRLEVPYHLRGRSQLECSIVNDGANPVNVFIVVKGTKLSK